MTERAGSDPRTATGRVSFVTFNYDRSLEWFLYTAAKNTFPNMTDERALQFLKLIDIVHVYGQLGQVHYRDDIHGSRPYRVESDPNHLLRVSSGIHLIPQGRAGSETFAKANELFQLADLIFFLGFGFNSTNVERLDLERAFQTNAKCNRQIPGILASTLNKTAAQLHLIESNLCRSKKPLFFNKDNMGALAEAGLIP